jgi:hypothetical protein
VKISQPFDFESRIVDLVVFGLPVLAAIEGVFWQF